MMSTKFVVLDENSLDRYSKGMMTPEQCRAARSWLNLSQSELAAAAKVGLSTLRDFEGGKRVPIANNLTAIQTVLVVAGIGFFEDEDGTSGIRYYLSRRND
jgi:DNA-binding transcriptional regulator YiaG